MKHLRPIIEKKPKGAPDWHDSDAPDANGRFKDLSIKDLAAWLIKTRKKDVKRISGSLTQQIVFNRNDDPKYAEKMEKTRKEVYKQLGREDLLESTLKEGYQYFDGEMARDLKGDSGVKFKKGDKVTLEIQPNNYVIYGPNKTKIIVNKRDFRGAIDQYVIYESLVIEKREDVGKYNTVKKVIKELGRRPSEQELATFINNNYYDVTEVERGDDDPTANDKIADLVGFYKFDIDDWEIAWFDAQNESVVNEEKIKYAKGKTYQSSGHWTVMVDSNSSMCDIRVNHSAGWRLDPHDDREETWELLDNGRQRATLNFKSGNIDKFAKQMFDLNDRTTWGNKTKLTAEDYGDIIRVWIDMKKANESIVNEAKFNLKAIGLAKWYIKTQDRMSEEDIIDALVNDDGYNRNDVEGWMNNNYDKLKESLVTEASKDRMIKQIKRALKDGLSIFKLPMATQKYYNKNKGDFEVVAEKGYNMEDIYDLIAFHRFNTDFRKLSSKNKEWVENDAAERGFNESLLESDIVDKYYSLIDELYEAKPGPDAYMTGLSDKEKEEKEAKMKKQAEMDDDDPDSYEELPGDEEAREKGKVKKSKHTTAYNKKFKSEGMKNLKSFDNFVTEKRSDLWSPFQKADILAGDMFGAMGLYRLEDDELDQIIDLKKADKLAKKMFGEFGFKTLAAKEMEELLDNNPKLLRESVVNEAEQYITDKFKVGDKIKTGFGEWEVIETDYAPKKSFMGSFIFKGKDMKRVNIPNPPKTNKNAVGYKVTDGDKYPIIGFLYQYKDITKLATVGVDESVVTEAKAYKLKASEFGADTHSAAYNVKGETTWRVHSTYAIDQVSGENNPEERDVVFFEAMPINNDIYIKIGGINNLKRSNGATVGNNFGTTIEEWKKDPKGIAKEASEFLTDATHLKWINKKARSEGQTIKWALKDDYSSVIEDLVNKSLGLSEKVVYNSSNTKPEAAKKATKEFGKLLPKPNKGVEPYEFAVVKTKAKNYRLAIKSGSYVAHEFMTNLTDDGVLTADIVKNAVSNIIKMNPEEFNESIVNNQSIFSDIVQDFEDFVKEKKSLNEASRRKVHKAAKQGSYPAVIVVVQDGKVIHQEPVSTPDVAPATFNVMQEKYPKALLHLEDKTGKRLFSEAKRIFLSNMNESKQSDELAIAINAAIEKIDDSMSYVDFAQAVGKVIRDEYGTHLYKEFKKEINKSLKESVNEKNRMLRKGQFRFGAKLQYGIEDVNESYGFYGTLLDQFGLDEVNELFLDGFAVLETNYDFTDQAALYYLNSKAGRWVADQVVEKLIGPKNMSPYYGHLEEIFAEYAKKGQWKKWAKEYDQFAEEDNMEEGLMIKESRSDRDEYYRELLEAEQTTNDQSPLGDGGMETGIKNKAKESGVPVGLLRIIMRRGLAAWKTGHRPGATQAQWGYARVNSFLTKQPGTWGKADSDIAKKVRDGGHDKDL